MAIYGNSAYATMSLTEDKMVSVSEMFNFINESDMEMACMFERANIVQIIKEDNTELAIPTNVEDSSNPETVKKTVIEKVKELINKFISFVKTSFQKLVEGLKKFYIEHNIQDSIISKWKDKVTWENLQMAREKGWKGCPITSPMIGKHASVTESGLYQNIYENNIKVEKDIDPIILAEDYSNAKKIYDSFKVKCNNFKKEVEIVESPDIYKWRADFDLDVGRSGTTYFIITATQHEVGGVKYYYPNKDGFISTKSFAETGEKKIKELQFGAKDAIKQMNLSKDVELNNMKSYKNGGSNVSEDKEINKISILYYKARYEYASTMIFMKSKIMQSVIKVLKEQHQYAIKCYGHFISAYHISQKKVVKEA